MKMTLEELRERMTVKHIPEGVEVTCICGNHAFIMDEFTDKDLQELLDIINGES